jgi:hypothetical protein
MFLNKYYLFFIWFTNTLSKSFSSPRRHSFYKAVLKKHFSLILLSHFSMCVVIIIIIIIILLLYKTLVLRNYFIKYNQVHA